MKINTTKKKKAAGPKLNEVADQLGQAYEAAAEAAKAANSHKEGINAKIKLVAGAEGTKDGDKTLVRGKSFAVGFQTIPAYTASLQVAQKELKPDVLKQVTKTVVLIDEDAFKKAVDAGEITRAQAATIVTQTGSQDRLFVQRLNK